MGNSVTQQYARLSPAVVIGSFKVMHRPDEHYQITRDRLSHQGFYLKETDHFLLAHPAKGDYTILVHRFQASEVDNNLVDYLMQEIPDLLTSDSAFGQVMIGVVNSIKPHDPVAAWGLFSLNTLRRLRAYLDESSPQHPSTAIGASATIYRRLLSLKVGESLLDVGCACAFWPVLATERDMHAGGAVIGIDIRLDAIHLSQHLAELVGRRNLAFRQLDLLSREFADELGSFDTVTAIHLLEHLPEEQLPLAFEHLLQVTRRRLLVAVPYEEEATRAYGHEQVFTPEKLERWGKWCVELLGDDAHYWCEEVAGGLLVVSRVVS